MTPACFYWFWIGKVKPLLFVEVFIGNQFNRRGDWGRLQQKCLVRINRWWAAEEKTKLFFFLCHSGHVARINDQLFRERTGCGDQRNQARAWPERGKKADSAFSVSPRVKSYEGASGGSVHWVCVRGQHHLDKPESTCSCDWHLGLHLLIKLKVLKVLKVVVQEIPIETLNLLVKIYPAVSIFICSRKHCAELPEIIKNQWNFHCLCCIIIQWILPGVHFSLDVLLSWANQGSCAHKCIRQNF